MKKNLNFLMCLAVAGMFFASCEKDEENGGGGNSLGANGAITATVENGANYNSEIDSVYAELEWETTDGRYGYGVIAKALYNNGSFSITLPETVDAKYLYAFNEEELESLTISDETAKSASVYEFDAVKNGGKVGYLYRSNIDANAIEGMEADELISLYANGVYSVGYLYVDKPLTVTGSYVDDNYFDDLGIEVPTNINISLQKGWNTVVTKVTLTVSATGGFTGSVNISNSEPAGLKWFYSPYYSYYDDEHAGNAKSAKSSVLSLPIRKLKLF